MNLESTRIIRRTNNMSPNLTKPKTDDFVFFVLRSNASTFESDNTYEDTFCVVHGSYANCINKSISTCAITQTHRKPSTAERIGTTNGCNLLQPISLLNTSKQTKENNYGSDVKTVFNLKLFRDYLTLFEVHPNSSITYMDKKHKVCSVQTEADFLKLWKFAKSCAKRNKGVLLLIDIANNPDDNMINSNNKIATVKDQKSPNTINVNLRKNEEDKIEVNDTSIESYSKQFDPNNDYDTFNQLVNISTSCSRILTKENNDTNLQNPVSSHINDQDFLSKTPPIWFVQYMEQFKQDIIKEVSDQVTLNVKENLNECAMKSSGQASFKNAIQFGNQVYNHKSKYRNAQHYFMDQKRQYQSIVKTQKIKENKFEGKLEYNSEEDNSKETANNHDKLFNISKFTDDMNNIYVSDNTTVENETVNNNDSMPPQFLESQESLKENLYKPNVSNVKEGSEFRMNCSITEHQMLDEKNFSSETCCCGCDSENISVSSDVYNEEDVSTECNFEMIQKPSSEEVKCFFLKNKDTNNRDISGFSFLPEISSPQPVSICIDEDHFTANSNNIPTSSENSDLNVPSFCQTNDKESNAYDDINIAMYNGFPFSTSNKCQDHNLNEFTKSICKKIMENSLIKIHDKTDTESECSNTINLKTDVNDSHTSYMTTKPVNAVYSDSSVTQTNCHAHDLNDLTQSFHSHTTSIADNGVYDIRETNTTTSHDYSKHNLLNTSKPTNSKENRTQEQMKTDISNKNPDRKMSREKSNAKNGKHMNEDTAFNSIPGTAEPVHILPETFVNGALHFASFAYGTAREAIVKIRSSSKDDRSSRARRTRY